MMTSEEFIRTLAEYGARLAPNLAPDLEERRRYVDTRLGLAQKLGPAPSPSSNLDAFRERIMADGNAESILRLVAGALALRRHELPSGVPGKS